MEAHVMQNFLLIIFLTALISAATAEELEVELVPVTLPPVPGPLLVHPHTAPSPLLAPAHAPSHHHHHHHAPAPAPAHHHAPAPAPAHHHAPAPAPAHHHHHHPHHAHAPTHAPSHAPGHAPAHAPSHAPAHAPSHAPAHAPSKAPAAHPHVSMPRSFIAVQGVVYCKPCKYAGVDTLMGASPLLGAEVKLECNNTKKAVTATTKTDMHGYFFMAAPKTITTYAFHKCKATLGASPQSSCSKPSALHGGHDGAVLRPVKPFMANKLPFVLYSVGPFAFEPQC